MYLGKGKKVRAAFFDSSWSADSACTLIQKVRDFRLAESSDRWLIAIVFEQGDDVLGEDFSVSIRSASRAPEVRLTKIIPRATRYLDSRVLNALHDPGFEVRCILLWE